MKMLFDELMEIIIKSNFEWVSKKEENKLILTNDLLNYQNEYVYDEVFNHKIRSKVKNSLISYREKYFENKQLAKEIFHFIICCKEVRYRISLSVNNNGKIKEPKPSVCILTKKNSFKYCHPDLQKDLIKELKNEINTFIDEIKNLNEFRLHYLFL